MSSGLSAGKIYVLIEHGTHEIRYVGQTTVSLERRLYLHCFVGPNGVTRTDHRTMWIMKQLRMGTPPQIQLVQELAYEALDEAERYWIREFRAQGCSLTNIHVGGNGGWRYATELLGWPKGVPKSQEHRAKISATLLGRKLPQETRANMSAARRRDADNFSRKTLSAWREGRLTRERAPIGCITCRKECLGPTGLKAHITQMHK